MTQSSRYLIAEDEPLLAQALQRALMSAWPEAQCIGIAANGACALLEIEAQRPDAVFLDVRMPQRDGLEVARELCARPAAPVVVFVTAYDEYALQAFDAAALDYLLKPVDPQRLARCIERVRQRVMDRDARVADMLQCVETLLAQRQRAPLRFVRAGAGAMVKLIAVEDILWFASADKYVTVATRDGDSFIRTPLRELMPQLDPEVFWHVHRGTIVNSRHIAAAKPDENGRVELTMRGRPEKLEVSRQFAHLFKRM